VFDACAHLARVTETARESTLFRAWAAGDSAALACAPVGAVVNVTCDVEALDPAYGAPAYRAWERLFGDDEGDAGTTAGAFREPRVSDDVDAARAPVDPDFPEETSTTPRGDGAAHTADDREFQIHANFAPRRDNVYHAFGVHPSRAAEVDAAASAARVARFARETRAVAVGVCGCDFRRADEDARRAQLEVLAGCMAVARGEVDASGADDVEALRGSAAALESDETNGAFGKEPRKRTDGRVAPATPATPLAVLLVSLGGADADDALFAAFLTHRDACVAAGASAVPAVFLDPSPRLAAAALARTPDALVSVSGAVTHAKNVALLEVAFDVPLDRIALASEAPGKIPTRLVGRLGRLGKSAPRNSKGTKTREWSHPASLAFAAEKVAEVKGRGVTAEDVVAAAARNARRAFLGRRE
jgi:Tat protein secretion system quality control protein TatD with DNase activity